MSETTSELRLKAIYRYPVKGLSGELLEEARLTPGDGIMDDRAYGLQLASPTRPAAFAPAAPSAASPKDNWLPKKNFLNLFRDNQLAQLDSHYDSKTTLLTLARRGRKLAAGHLNKPTGRLLIENFFASYLKTGPRSQIKVVKAQKTGFYDNKAAKISVINLASVEDLSSRVLQTPVDPRRFRANLLVEGLPPFGEFSRIGDVFSLGSAKIRLTERIERCRATTINPDTGEEDINVPLALRRGYGHIDCGVYAEVIEGGLIHPA